MQKNSGNSEELPLYSLFFLSQNYKPRNFPDKEAFFCSFSPILLFFAKSSSISFNSSSIAMVICTKNC